MEIYWIYELSTWQLGVLIIGVTTFISVLGLRLLRNPIRTLFSLSSDTNEPINGYFSGAGVFYGLLLGLVAVATWESYADVDSLVSRESSEVASLYRDISSFPQPEKAKLQKCLQDYLGYVIHTAWPGHKKGLRLQGGTVIMSKLQKILAGFHPVKIEEQTLQAEALRAFNQLTEARRLRLDAVDTGLPAVLWFVVIFGAILSVIMTYFFHFSHQQTHYLMTGLLGLFLGIMIFLIVAIDHPFRGDEGVSADAYQQVLDSLPLLDPETAEQAVSPVP